MCRARWTRPAPAGTQNFERSTYNTDTPSFNGNRAQANNYTLEGIDMNETYNNLISYSPAPEALQEVQVITANSPSDYGNVNGAGVVTVLKSGTNQFHGSAYGYVQDYRFDANSYPNGRNGTPTNPFSFAQFGGTIGGPILRNKLFFFGDYLGSRWHKGGLSTASVIPDAMRNGDFSALLSGDNPIQLYDPLNGFAPYQGNQMCRSTTRWRRSCLRIRSTTPIAAATTRRCRAAASVCRLRMASRKTTYQAPNPQYKGNNQGDVKIEYDPRQNDKITGFYSMSHAYDGSVPVGDYLPRRESISDMDCGQQLGARLLVVAGELGAHRLYTHGLEPGVPAGPDGSVRHRRQCKGGHRVSQPEVRRLQQSAFHE